MQLTLDAHRADMPLPGPITLDMEFAAEGGEGPTPYEVLLHAAIVGDDSRFTRQDGVEEAWRIMQPLLDHAPPVQRYAPGSWGPDGADELVSGSAAGTGRGSRPEVRSAGQSLGGRGRRASRSSAYCAPAHDARRRHRLSSAAPSSGGELLVTPRETKWSDGPKRGVTRATAQW